MGKYLQYRQLSLILLLLPAITSINFPLSKSRETCLLVPSGSYQYEFVSEGNTEDKVRCAIFNGTTELITIMGKSQYEGEVDISHPNGGKFCFSSLDNNPKALSFDYFSLQDPLKGLISDQNKMKTHQSLFASFQEFEKVYRDQHFYRERNSIHSIILRNTEITIVFFVLLKVTVAILCACCLLVQIKKIVEVSSTSSSNTTEIEMEE